MLSGSKLEAAYTVKFTVSSTAVREAMMTERQSGVAPDMGAMVQLRERMTALRKEELAAARPLFTPVQHSRFDENVKAEDAERETERERMGGVRPQSMSWQYRGERVSTCSSRSVFVSSFLGSWNLPCARE